MSSHTFFSAPPELSQRALRMPLPLVGGRERWDASSPHRVHTFSLICQGFRLHTRTGRRTHFFSAPPELSQRALRMPLPPPSDLHNPGPKPYQRQKEKTRSGRKPYCIKIPACSSICGKRRITSRTLFATSSRSLDRKAPMKLPGYIFP